MKNLAVAIDFGTSKVIGIMAESGDTHRCQFLARHAVAYSGYDDEGVWNNESEITGVIDELIKELENQSKRKIREVFVGVPGEHLRLYNRNSSINVGTGVPITQQDASLVLDEAVKSLRIGSGTVISRSPAYYTVDDGQPTMSPVDQLGNKLSVCASVLVADQEYIDNMNLLFGKFDITVRSFLSPALSEAVLCIPPENRDKIAALIDVGYLHTELMIMQGDAMMDYQVIPMGGVNLSLDLRWLKKEYGLDVNFEIAEKIKRAYTFGSKENITIMDGSVTKSYPYEYVSQIINARVDELAEMIKDALDDSVYRIDPNLPIYLTGNGLMLSEENNGTTKYFGERLHRSNITIPASRVGNFNSPAYASALGMIDSAFDYLEGEVDESRNILGWVKALPDKLSKLRKK